MTSDSKPHIYVLYSHNPSRLAHLRKIGALRGRYRFTLVMDEKQPVDWQEKYADSLLRLPVTDAFLNEEEIIRRVRKHGVPDGVLHLSEPCLPLWVLLGEAFGIAAPRRDAAAIGRDKYAMRLFAADAGIPIPGFCRVTRANLDAAQRLSFPVIAKPVIGGGSTLVKRFDGFEDLKEDFERMQAEAGRIYAGDSQISETLRNADEGYPFMIEELIGGETLFETRLPADVGEISVESVHENGRTHILAIHDKPLPGNGPYFEEFVISTPTRMPQSHIRMAAEYVDRIHKRLGEGSFVLHTEFRTLRDRLVLLEFGIRIGGGPVYRSVLLSTGNDFLEILIDLGLRRKPRIRKDRAIPTITQLLFAPRPGRIRAFHGENRMVCEPDYAEHQIYDDIGDMAYRAPLSSRCNAHAVFQNASDGFPALERNMEAALAGFSIAVE